MTPCPFYLIKACPASFSIISTKNPWVPPMQWVQPGPTTSSSNPLPTLWRLCLSTPAKAAPLYTTTGPGQGWQPPPQALRLLPLTLPSPLPLHPRSPLGFLVFGLSPLRLPFPITGDPTGILKAPSGTRVAGSSLTSGCERLTFLAGSCFLLARINLLFLHSFLVHAFYSFQRDWV